MSLKIIIEGEHDVGLERYRVLYRLPSDNAEFRLTTLGVMLSSQRS